VFANQNISNADYLIRHIAFYNFLFGNISQFSAQDYFSKTDILFDVINVFICTGNIKKWRISMKKKMVLVVITVLTGFLSLSVSAMAAPEGTVHLNWGQYLNSGDTACPSGKPLINVTRKVINSLDSGTGLSDYDNKWWATSYYNQHIKVVETEDGFCATVTYQGKFESVGGDGPGCALDSNCGESEGRLEAGVTGTFQGGYTADITPADGFNPNDLPTRGNLGTVDPDCDAEAGICDFSPSFGWIQEYFPGANYSLIWWGWVYHAGKNGTWVNAQDPPGNQGNITGE
jgi:hypothetical protein